MEAALASDDPRLQSTLSGGDTATLIRKAPGSLLLGGGLILAGIAILFTGLISQIAPVGVVGFIVTLTGLLMALRSVSVKAPRMAAPKRSLNDRLQERWDRRTFE
jgi:uncharacterized membrane protein HdeD (DUF308 family)